ncbi:unnamed protein product [Aphanomyces euteiches]|uniref:FYVE-type domain-containing protein n=1 Tax=Aphanomyces euteiches TaxID=100861 RepID=A0A6G0WBG0_9STRA|nr:hypothetical protein Ae201684_017551 [Aphanomyces euteiches]KAH9068592.1 hypothetical protein Ae201684P_004294 [Aphanomyces euteiches]KAH9155360.1 hypothetical protein AeRB84_002655 [Aphanomyces euteiches]
MKRQASLPLPAGFFRSPSLAQHQERQLIRSGLQSLTDVIRDSRLDGAIPWTLQSQTKSLRVYSSTPNAMTATHTIFMFTAELRATLDEVYAIMRFQEHADFQRYCTTAAAKDIIDCASLYNLALPTPNHPRNYVGVKWIAAASANPLGKKRDACYVEFQDDFEVDGHRGWARALTSVEVDACPNLQLSHGLVRMDILRAGFVFTEMETSGFIHVANMYHVDFGTHMPPWMIDMTIRKRAKIIDGIELMLEQQRPQPMQSPRAACGICSRKFGMLVKRYHCRRCAISLCKNCKHTSRQDRTNICSRCFLETSTAGNYLPKQEESFVETTSTVYCYTSRRESDSMIRQDRSGSAVFDSNGRCVGGDDMPPFQMSVRGGIKLLDSPTEKLLVSRRHRPPCVASDKESHLAAPTVWDRSPPRPHATTVVSLSDRT